MTANHLRPVPSASREVSRDYLETIAYLQGVPIELPAGRAGWARCTTAQGERLHAWMPGVEVSA